MTRIRRIVRACLPRILALAVGLVASLALMPGAAFADAYKDALAKFSNDSFGDTDAAVTALAASGHPMAEAVVRALQDGRLLAGGGRTLIRDGAALRDAATGEAVTAAPEGVSAVRLNNRVRRTVAAALGSLTLLSPDRARRLSAAAAVFKARDATALPALEEALAREGDRRIAKVMGEARAAILFTRPDSNGPQRMEAVDILLARGDQDALAILANPPAGMAPEIAAAAAGAAETIRGRLELWRALQNAWYGLSLGSVLLLAAIGLAITFGTMGVINMAHGEMVMLGAYTTFVVQELIRAHAPWLFGGSLFIAIPLAFLVAGAVGIAIERGVIRFLYGRPLETLLATWGLSLMLQQAVRTLFGPTNREVGTPAWMSGALEIGGLSLTYNRIAIVVFALIVFTVLLLVLRYTPLGLHVRAVTQNRRMAGSMGIATSRIDALTFGLGSGVAGIAGVALSQIDNVSPNLGQSYIIDSFMVVVFGGVGNLWGTLVGALTLGIANKFLEPYAGAVLGKILLLVAIILFIQRRPRGLFALKGRAVEA